MALTEIDVEGRLYTTNPQENGGIWLPRLARAESSGSSIVVIGGNLKAKRSGGLESYWSDLLPSEGRALDACHVPVKEQVGGHEESTVGIYSQMSGMVAFNGTGQLKDKTIEILFLFKAQLES